MVVLRTMSVRLVLMRSFSSQLLIRAVCAGLFCVFVFLGSQGMCCDEQPYPTDVPHCVFVCECSCHAILSIEPITQISLIPRPIKQAWPDEQAPTSSFVGDIDHPPEPVFLA
jgi:hypothetical protein